MCGFAGVISWDEDHRVTRAMLEKMSRAIAHRGPDGEGYHLTREHEPIDPDHPQVGLAFRRLAILDPDPRSNQPFHLGPLTLVFNGEIYNFRELRSELSKLRPDHVWRTTGDTEVLLVAFDVWREKCVEKLNGMFAFAVWDEQKKELFLARDRMGQKPLYIATNTGHMSASSLGWLIKMKSQAKNLAIAFASEIPALKMLSWANTEIQPSFICDYLMWGYSGTTAYGGIGSLARSTTSTITADRTLDQAYGEFDTSEPLQFLDDETAIKQTRVLVSRAVRRQLVTDVPLGCFLSGGIDSSTLAAAACMAREKDEEPLRTFSIGFEDPRYDERKFAAEVAKHLRTQHETFVVSIDAAADLPRVAASFGEPFGDSSSLPTYYLSRAAAGRVKVCLSGDGGDELFGGYERYRAMLWAKRLSSLSPMLPSRVADKLRSGYSGHPKEKWTRVKRFLSSLDLPSDQRYQNYLLLDGQSPPHELIEPFAQKAGNWPHLVEMQFRFAEKKLGDPVRAALATDRFVYLPLDLLTKVDRCSMMHGLEVRSPFMDHELVQFAAGLTTDQLLKGGPKRMLREAFAKDLPDFVFKRKKMGFAVPIGEWFRGELRSMLRDNLFASDSFGKSHFNMNVVERLVEEHEQNRVDHSQRLYALLMLELWWQQQKNR
jgi:asparagine synthase (glutamine-hydrolysing)